MGGATDIWQLRAQVFRQFAEMGRGPSLAEIAAEADIGEDAAWDALAALEAKHALVLDHDGRAIVMAHPFSAVETPFTVESGGVSWWANCAWDTFGILAALGRDGVIHAEYAEDQAPVDIPVRGGKPEGEGVVHLLLPAREWTEDFFET